MFAGDEILSAYQGILRKRGLFMKIKEVSRMRKRLVHLRE